MLELLKKTAAVASAVVFSSGAAFASISNENTGYDSENNASVELESEVEVDTDNNVHLDNDVDGTIKTGYNASSYNTGSGEVDTGDAKASISVTSRANESSVEVEISESGANVNSVTNDTTGAQSENNAWIEVENELEIDVDNHACVDTDVALLAKTGGNESSYNTGNGSVSTGDASITVSLSSTVNSSEVEID